MKLETVRLVGEVLQNSWGSESSRDGTYSIKHDLSQERLTLKYTMVVHFASESSIQPQIEAANIQAIQLCDAKLALLKKSFKSITGSPLRVKDLGGQDSFELIQPTGPRKVAYYRYNHSFDIQD